MNSSNINCLHVLDTPDAPRNVTLVELSHNAVGLEWSAPHNDGGAPVTSYVIERRHGSHGRFAQLVRAPVRDTYFRDATVREGMTYEYRVAAENAAGVGVFSAASEPILVQDLIGLPPSEQLHRSCNMHQ